VITTDLVATLQREGDMNLFTGFLSFVILTAGAATAHAERVKFDLRTSTFISDANTLSSETQTVEGELKHSANGKESAIVTVPIKFKRTDTNEEIATTFTLFANHTFTFPDREEVFSIRTWINESGVNLPGSPSQYVRLKSFDAFLATLNETEWRRQKNAKGKPLKITLRAEVLNFEVVH
jgi:hypothetical protein